MRIAFISHWAGRGGAEKALIEIMEAARSAGHDVYCFVPNHGWLEDELKRRLIPCIHTPYPWWAGSVIPWWLRFVHLLRLPLAAYRLSAYLRPSRMDRYIHTNMPTFDLVYSNSMTICAGAIAAKLAGIPHLWHIHETIIPNEGIQFFLPKRFCERIIRKLSAVIVGASNVGMQSMDLNGHALYPPPTVSKVSKDVDPRCIVTACHLARSKRVADAIEAVRLLTSRGYDVSLRVIGDGEESENLKALAEGLPVTFVGPVSDVSQEVANAAALVNCCAIEGFGRINLEAASLRTPVIAANSGGNMELITHGVNGLLFQPGDIEGLAEQIKRTLDYPDFACELAERAYAHANQIASADAFQTKVDSLLRLAASGPAASPRLSSPACRGDSTSSAGT